MNTVEFLLLFGLVMLIMSGPFCLAWFLISGNALWDDKANNWPKK